MMPYEKLQAWRVCHELALAVYQTTKAWPRSELHGLIAQARRAAFSPPVNMAEGAAKQGPLEFGRYLDIALGSLSDLSHTLRLARDLGYLSEPEWERMNLLRSRAGQLTWRLRRSVAPAHPCGSSNCLNAG